jgi:hypothetical protein
MCYASFFCTWCFSFSYCLLGLHFYVVASEYLFWFGNYALFSRVVMLLGFCVWTMMVVGVDMVAHHKLER